MENREEEEVRQGRRGTYGLGGAEAENPQSIITWN